MTFVSAGEMGNTELNTATSCKDIPTEISLALKMLILCFSGYLV